MNDMTTYLGWKIDYKTPPGEPAGQHPLSVHWRVFKNPVAMAIGGIAAVIMEFADPRIRSGVWDHSIYKTDPIGRSKRTGVAAMAGVYGPRSAARRIFRGVMNMHGKVTGKTPDGQSYTALDPVLLDWVAATGGYGMLMAYDRFVHRLPEAEKTRYFAEVDISERPYGVTYTPQSVDDFLQMMRERESIFEPHSIVTEFLDIIESGRAAPGIPKFMHRALARAAVSIVPPMIRNKLQLEPTYKLTLFDQLIISRAGRRADRKVTPGSPAYDASIRLGLPGDFLYRPAKIQRQLVEAAGLSELDGPTFAPEQEAQPLSARA